MKEYRRDAYLQQELAELFGVSGPTVKNYVRNIPWEKKRACSFCGTLWSKPRAWSLHQTRCKKNPDYEEISKRRRERIKVWANKEEVKKRTSERMKGSKNPMYGVERPEFRGELNPIHRPEVKKKYHEGMHRYRERFFSNPIALKRRREKASKSMLNKWEIDGEYRGKILSHIELLNKNLDYIMKRREHLGRINSDPIVSEKRLKALQKRPTKPERILIKLIKQFELPFEYTGNGKTIIGNKNPDFTDTLGLSKVIEVYGDYWHKDENPNNDINFYNRHGYGCLVIWEYELKKDVERVRIKIKEFLIDIPCVVVPEIVSLKVKEEGTPDDS